MPTQREISKQDWSVVGRTTIEQVNSGSLQRIADAVESIARNYNQLQEERDRYKRWYEQEHGWRLKNEAKIAAYKGVVTKLKRKLNSTP